jgi:N utilization substance protein B
MQSLYEWEFRQGLSLDEIGTRNVKEIIKEIDEGYVWKVLHGIQNNITAINDLICEAAPEWPLEQIARVDKNILRVAIFEMLFDPEIDIPPRVSINEAIEIGKNYGSESSAKFINGVLGYIYRKNQEKLSQRDAH